MLINFPYLLPILASVEVEKKTLALVFLLYTNRHGAFQWRQQTGMRYNISYSISRFNTVFKGAKHRTTVTPFNYSTVL